MSHHHDPVMRAVKKLIKTAGRQLPADDDHRIHRLRVCTKQLRALLQIYRPVIAKNRQRHSKSAATTAAKTGNRRRQFDDLQRQLQDIAKHYAQSRDAAVSREMLLSLLHDCHATPSQCEFLLAQFPQGSAITTAAVADTGEQLRSLWRDWKRFRRECATRSQGAGAAPGFADGIRLSYAKARKLARRARRESAPEDYHRCRKWVKYLLYQIEYAAPVMTFAAGPYCADLQHLADHLGLLHDRHLLLQRLQQLAATDPVSTALVAPLELRRAELDAIDLVACHRLFDRLFRSPHCPLC